MRRYVTFKKPFLLRSDPQLLSLPLGLTTGPQLKTDRSSWLEFILIESTVEWKISARWTRWSPSFTTRLKTTWTVYTCQLDLKQHSSPLLLSIQLSKWIFLSSVEIKQVLMMWSRINVASLSQQRQKRISSKEESRTLGTTCRWVYAPESGQHSGYNETHSEGNTRPVLNIEA